MALGYAIYSPHCQVSIPCPLFYRFKVSVGILEVSVPQGQYLRHP